jgi:hypothetical protein
MPQPTYTALATVTLSTATATATFSNVPSTYRDLVVVMTGTTSVDNFTLIRLNGDSGNNYFQVFMSGSGSGVGASGTSTVSYALLGDWTTTQSTALAHIMDYSATDKHKTILVRGNTTKATIIPVAAIATRWANTAAVNSVFVAIGSGTMAAGTTISLYGIAS